SGEALLASPHRHLPAQSDLDTDLVSPLFLPEDRGRQRDWQPPASARFSGLRSGSGHGIQTSVSDAGLRTAADSQRDRQPPCPPLLDPPYLYRRAPCARLPQPSLLACAAHEPAVSRPPWH